MSTAKHASAGSAIRQMASYLNSKHRNHQHRQESRQLAEAREMNELLQQEEMLRAHRQADMARYSRPVPIIGAPIPSRGFGQQDEAGYGDFPYTMPLGMDSGMVRMASSEKSAGIVGGVAGGTASAVGDALKVKGVKPLLAAVGGTYAVGKGADIAKGAVEHFGREMDQNPIPFSDDYTFGTKLGFGQYGVGRVKAAGITNQAVGAVRGVASGLKDMVGQTVKGMGESATAAKAGLKNYMGQRAAARQAYVAAKPARDAAAAAERSAAAQKAKGSFLSVATATKPKPLLPEVASVGKAQPVAEAAPLVSKPTTNPRPKYTDEARSPANTFEASRDNAAKSNQSLGANKLVSKPNMAKLVDKPVQGGTPNRSPGEVPAASSTPAGVPAPGAAATPAAGRVRPGGKPSGGFVNRVRSGPKYTAPIDVAQDVPAAQPVGQVRATGNAPTAPTPVGKSGTGGILSSVGSVLPGLALSLGAPMIMGKVQDAFGSASNVMNQEAKPYTPGQYMGAPPSPYGYFNLGQPQ